MSFRRRVILSSAAAVAVAILIASVIVYVAVRAELRSQVDEDLRDDASGAFSFRVPAPASDEEARLPGVEPTVQPLPGDQELILPAGPLGTPEAYAQLVTSGGDVVRPEDSPIDLPNTPAAREVASGDREAFFADETVDGLHLRVYTSQVGSGEAIQVARPLDEVDATLGRLLLVLGLVSGGGVALAAGLGVIVSRAALAPVARLSQVAERVAETRDLSRRIEAGGGDELATLARSFNRMLGELERSVEAQRQLVADASHELRTPLTSLRTNIEILGRSDGLDPDERARMMASVVAQLDELTVLVGDLVDLARDAAQDEEQQELRLDLLVEDMTERARRHRPEVRFEFTGQPCTVLGYPAALERAVFNLLDNGAKWSPESGRVEVRVTTAGEVTVRDHGPGIPAEDLPHVFDRFYRAASARGMPGSGLGLAIVRQIAEAHGGSVAAEPAPGGGALLRLEVPATAKHGTAPAL